MLKVGDYVKILNNPNNPENNIIYSVYVGYVAKILKIVKNCNCDNAILNIPEKFFLQHKDSSCRAPVNQLEKISKEQFDIQVNVSIKKCEKYCDNFFLLNK